MVVFHQRQAIISHPRMMSYLQGTTPDKVNEREFVNPDLAFYILSKLDTVENFDEVVTDEEGNTIQLKEKPYLGIRANDNYCLKHRALFTYHPERLVNIRNVFSNYRATSVFRRSIIPKMGGKDAMPHIHSKMDEGLQNETIFDLREDINMFFTSNSLKDYQIVGQQFSCLTQVSNHIPGHDKLYRKDEAGKSLVEYGKLYKDRPQCFNDNMFFPKTWILTNEAQCKEFFEIFNSPVYEQLKKERGLVYMRKIGAGAHQGHGVKPVQSLEEVKIRKRYENGTLCGQEPKNNLIQYAVWNPLLIKGRKFDFRMFLLIASTNPLIAYYRDGFLRISLRNYDPLSEEPGTIITNIALSKPFFDLARENGTYNGYTAEELNDQVFWMMPQLEQYLLEEGKIADPDWLNNYLRPQFKKAYIHLLRMSQTKFMKHSSLYEIYGLDFMLDEHLNLWFIEANSAPLLDGWSDASSKFFNQIIYDSADIVFGLLKSRIKRIIQFVNKLTLEKQVWRTVSGDLVFKDLEAAKKGFESAASNRFEPEYQVSADNGFHLIIDENLKGAKKYFGYLEEECI